MRDLKQELRDELEEILPKSQHGKIDKLVAVFESYYDTALNSIEVIGAHIETDSVEYPGGTVGLDAAGNMISATFDYDCMVIT
jgi:hypothetical protein